jgi:hypothetical protein
MSKYTARTLVDQLLVAQNRGLIQFLARFNRKGANDEIQIVFTATTSRDTVDKIQQHIETLYKFTAVHTFHYDTDLHTLIVRMST